MKVKHDKKKIFVTTKLTIVAHRRLKDKQSRLDVNQIGFM